MSAINIKLFETLNDTQADAVFDFSLADHETQQFATEARAEIDPGECAFLFDDDGKVLGLLHITTSEYDEVKIIEDGGAFPENPAEIDDFRLVKTLPTVRKRELLSAVLNNPKKVLGRLLDGNDGVIVRPSVDLFNIYPEGIGQAIESGSPVLYIPAK